MCRISELPKKAWTVLALIGVTAFVTLLAYAKTSDAPSEDGKELYLHNCAVCHAADGSGDTYFGKRKKVAPLRYAVKPGTSDAHLTEVISKGLGYQMSGYQKLLTPDEIRAIVAYIRSLSGAGPAETTSAAPSTSIEAGRRIFEDQSCLACHKIGTDGGTSGPDLTNVGCTRSRAQLLARMRARRAGTVMPALPPNMPDEQLNDLVDYMLSLKGTGCK
ncbi:MAG: c-type cytochrome [Acidobacteriia bacterium]|nr:c-type cytochrome [Terriglobia bacterium]